MPLYLKAHSYGEYVFDWAWADAYQRHGLEYYPKLAVRGAVHAGERSAPAGARPERVRTTAAGRAGARARNRVFVIARACSRRTRKSALDVPRA